MAELNPNIALSGLLINRNDENLKQARYQSEMLQNQQAQQQSADQGRLRDLLPGAMQGDPEAMQQIAGINPDLYMKLEDAQKQAVQAKLGDMGAAVRWAVSDPNQRAQRWSQVVDYYSKEFPQVAQYRDHPEMAEQALMQLGQMGEYLKGQQGGQPTALQRNYEFFSQKDPKLADQYLHNQAEGSPMIASNGDGTFTIIPRGYGTAPAPQGNVPPPPPGFVIDGGPSPSGSGGFPQ